MRLLQSGIAALAGRGVAVLVGIASVPLTVGYLGTERYGIWIVISTLLGWLAIADLGLGNGLVNALAACYGEEKPELAQRYVATAMCLMGSIALMIGIACILAWPYADWTEIINVQSDQARAETPVTVALALTIFLVGFPLTLAPRILDAYQEGAIGIYWSAAGNVASLGALIIVTHLRAGLPWLVAAVAGLQVIVNLGCAVWLFWRHKPWLAPHPGLFDRWLARELLGKGGMFFVVQIVALINLNTDAIIIARYLGPDHVTPYSIASRLFSYTTIFQTLLFPALWSAYAEAISRRDMAWVRRTLWKNLSLGGLSTLAAALVLVLFGETIIRVWAGPAAVPPQMLLMWLAGWSVIYACMSVSACVLNAAGQIRGQMMYGFVTGLVNIGLSIVLVRSHGITGVVMATAISYFIFAMVPQMLETWLFLRRCGS